MKHNKRTTKAPDGRKIVMIYSDPLTETKPEGKAILLSKVDEAQLDGMAYWNVCFQGDDGTVYQRWVKNGND